MRALSSRGMRLGALCVVVLLAWGGPASGVLLYSTPQRNTWAPAGALWNSGWQYQGKWGSFLGTPISPRHFITAEHVGGATGQTFSFRGKNYTAQSYHDDPNSDLRIWQVDRPFADAYAPIYRGTGEAGKQMVLYGRGTQRGTEVVVNNQRKGWRWGAADGLQSWGTNTVTTVLNGGAGVGQVLAMTFDATGGRDEGAVSAYDSGGGDFVNDNGVWKLAGVNYGARGPYSLTGATGSGFNASMFDEGGLWVGQDGRRWYVPDAAANVAGASYATRVSSEAAWIDSVIRPALGGTTASTAGSLAASTVPEPGLAGLAAGAIVALGMRRRRVR